MQPFDGLAAEMAQQEAMLERELKNAILDGRAGRNVRWSADLEYLLMRALVAYEREAKHGDPRTRKGMRKFKDPCQKWV